MKSRKSFYKTICLVLLVVFAFNSVHAGISIIKSNGITLTGADGITLTGADGITLTGADGFLSYQSNGITLTGADGIPLVLPNGITLTGADGGCGGAQDPNCPVYVDCTPDGDVSPLCTARSSCPFTFLGP